MGRRSEEQPADRELLLRAGDGDSDAFAELYRRHSGAAWTAARAVTSNPDDAADAVADAFTRTLRAVRNGKGPEITHFRAYLLTAARNAAVDSWRVRDEAVPEEQLAVDVHHGGRSPAEAIIDLTDGEFAARAFRELPERWRRVLWLTEVEGLSPGDAAAELGLKPNAAYQLAFRARARLRERFVGQHIRPDFDESCRETAQRLAAFATGTLRRGDHAAVASHLDECSSCRDRQQELADVVPGTKAAVAPVVATLADRVFDITSVFASAAERSVSTIGQVAAALVAVVAAVGAVPSIASDGNEAPPVTVELEVGVKPHLELGTSVGASATPDDASATFAVAARPLVDDATSTPIEGGDVVEEAKGHRGDGAHVTPAESGPTGAVSGAPADTRGRAEAAPHGRGSAPSADRPRRGGSGAPQGAAAANAPARRGPRPQAPHSTRRGRAGRSGRGGW